jgi:D-alanine transaminase
VFDRGYLFSDGIYELIPYFNKKSFLIDEHYHRLEKSLAMIDLKNPYEKKDWIENIERLVETCEFDNFSLYIQVTRGGPKNIDDGVFPDQAATKNIIPRFVCFARKYRNYLRIIQY